MPTPQHFVKRLRIYSFTIKRPPPLVRHLTTSPLTNHPTNPSAATSTSAAQPFSTPFTPSPRNSPSLPIASDKPSSSSSPPKSSTPAGTPLRGLNFLKTAEAPVAREDSEYPSWLWTLLDKSDKEGVGDQSEAVGDAFAKSKKQRRLAAKAARAKGGAAIDGEGARKVPLHEQSVDLPAGIGDEDGEKGTRAREDLRASMRDARRKKIREGNFLRGMR